MVAARGNAEARRRGVDGWTEDGLCIRRERRRVQLRLARRVGESRKTEVDSGLRGSFWADGNRTTLAPPEWLSAR